MVRGKLEMSTIRQHGNKRTVISIEVDAILELNRVYMYVQNVCKALSPFITTTHMKTMKSTTEMAMVEVA
jgi:hypothetical protein